MIEHDRDFIEALVLDVRDELLQPLIEFPTRVCNTLMSSRADCERIAGEVLELLTGLESSGLPRRDRERRTSDPTLPQAAVKRLA